MVWWSVEQLAVHGSRPLGVIVNSAPVTSSNSASSSSHEQSDDTAALIEAAASAGPAERAALEDEVVRRHLGLARHLAGRYAGRGIDREDLVQVANFALVKSIRGFRHDRGEFVPFATVTILGEIKKHFRDHGWGVRPPRRIQQLQADISSASERIFHAEGHAPDAAQIAAELGADLADVNEAMAARGCFSPTSLDQPVRDGGQPLGETLRWDESAFSFIDDWVTVGPLCRDLADDERELIRLRFVEDKTQQEIADLVGVSQMQVSRRLAKLLDQLRTKAAVADVA
ncbi:sigma-70 family RNA polymerase sigma factor [Aeromicrobium sp. SMF47]|uniref:Sigma-70 family RNA polymerase sigma factor n=1 Tax=Aeromicrobium yanjiei TaxID=2662028 RepID=A0A5Q2MJE8_9ACTN|nr:sigma-70 family RNA polymerase sigma factor [Aeromicrobium yanjiei]MRK02466.1 sigma-70 family RNA polymerase sigma factor [Aeromicrobium sp. S22]QGG40070.1 sigma-70 family RNA polymerase sigma factor [Aeromicrobium yanjiei]